MRNSLRMTVSFGGRFFRLFALFLFVAILTSLNGCGSGSGGKSEYAYVASPEAILRDRIAAVYSKTGVLHNGERVQVLERLANRRFVRVRSARGEEGWIQEAPCAGGCGRPRPVEPACDSR